MIVHYQFTDQQQHLREKVRALAIKKIKPLVKKADENGSFPRAAVESLAEAGLFGVKIPTQYGGMGCGLMEFSLVVEELARIDGAVATTFAASLLGTLPILLFGTEKQKQKYLPPLAGGKQIASFAISEPETGSDSSAIQTRAIKAGEKYRINGQKRFITKAGESEIISLFAVTDPVKGARGLSAFIIEKQYKGLSYGPQLQKLGIRASATRNIICQDLMVPEENLIGGKAGRGFIQAMKTFEHSRPGVAAQAVGIAQGSLDLALGYSKRRKQFGKPINTFQGLQWMLSDMEIQIEAARCLTYQVIGMVDRGEKAAAAAAAAKVFASDTAMKITTDAVQLHGGWGYMANFEVERFMRDAKVTQIYEGTNQILRNLIALRLIKGIDDIGL
ncbi:MAG: acyl-CoA dehydrogenase family protein [Spirochaetes bacterium]|nr:acyl-CoA dehydrogenase family protein [Spirochaetota bacterium]